MYVNNSNETCRTYRLAAERTAEREAPESTPCPTLTTLPVFLKHSLLVLDTYKAAVHVCRGLSADGV